MIILAAQSIVSCMSVCLSVCHECERLANCDSAIELDSTLALQYYFRTNTARSATICQSTEFNEIYIQ